jgi:hypothetical protein
MAETRMKELAAECRAAATRIRQNAGALEKQFGGRVRVSTAYADLNDLMAALADGNIEGAGTLGKAFSRGLSGLQGRAVAACADLRKQFDDIDARIAHLERNPRSGSAPITAAAAPTQDHDRIITKRAPIDRSRSLHEGRGEAAGRCPFSR